MKFQRIVVGLIAVILVVNVVGVGIIVAEERKQSELAYISARLDAYNVFANLGLSNEGIDIVEGFTQDWEAILIDNYDELSGLLHEYYKKEYGFE